MQPLWPELGLSRTVSRSSGLLAQDRINLARARGRAITGSARLSILDRIQSRQGSVPLHLPDDMLRLNPLP